jgi:hypothetical protein
VRSNCAIQPDIAQTCQHPVLPLGFQMRRAKIPAAIRRGRHRIALGPEYASRRSLNCEEIFMPKHLPYRATTSSGNQFEFAFPLHPDTGSAVNVSNLVDLLLAALDQEIRQIGAVSNGDVLQSLAMALAVRTRILPGNPEALAALSTRLLSDALGAPVAAAQGNISTDTPRDIH